MNIFKSLFNKKKSGDDTKQQIIPDNVYNAAHSSEIHKEEEEPVNSKENIPWRTFSVFISSTFADMQAERDHLKNVIFPAVEEELHKRRIKLDIVDLRWGVDTTSMEQEDEREANVLKVCLDEIKRCRPFFVGLLGDRYGWVPAEQPMKLVLAKAGITHPDVAKIRALLNE